MYGRAVRMSGRVRWALLALPLVLAASEGAQALLDRFASSGYQGAELLTQRRIGALVPDLVAGALVLVALGFVGHVVSGSRRRSVSRLTFALLPILVYAVQENVEYYLGHAQVAGTVLTQPTFLAGLALQLPFALLAYLVARLLVGLAAGIVERLAPSHRARSRLAPRGRHYRDPSRYSRLGVAAALGRGPPLLVGV